MCIRDRVSLEYDRKFRNFWGSTKAVRWLSDTICIENGLSIVENPKPHGKSYNKWLGDQAKPSHRELLRVAIDNALSQSPANFEELLKLLKESGCEVSKRGKSYRLKLPGWEKAARMDSLCLLYTSPKTWMRRRSRCVWALHGSTRNISSSLCMRPLIPRFISSACLLYTSRCV